MEGEGGSLHLNLNLLMLGSKSTKKAERTKGDERAAKLKEWAEFKAGKSKTDTNQKEKPGDRRGFGCYYW